MNKSVRKKLIFDSISWFIINYILGLIIIVSYILIPTIKLIYIYPSFLSSIISITITGIYSYFNFNEISESKSPGFKLVFFIGVLVLFSLIIGFYLIILIPDVADSLDKHSYILFIILFISVSYGYYTSYGALHCHALKERFINEKLRKITEIEKKGDVWENLLAKENFDVQ